MLATLHASRGASAPRDTALPGWLPLIGRAGIAAIFVISGASKLAAPAATIGYIEAVGLPLPQVALAVAILAALAGGLLLIAGYRVRLVAAGLALFSLVTAFGFHADFADQNQFIHFLKNLAVAGGLVQLVAFGGGRLSLDARR